LRATKFEFEKRFWIICATAVYSGEIDGAYSSQLAATLTGYQT